VRDWDAFVDRYFRNRILSVTVIDALPWRHPWFTELAWSTPAEQWTARINPGYCLSGTGADPQITVPANLASAETRERLSIEDEESDEPIDASLSELPSIPIAASRWRPIGTDAVVLSGSTAEPVPDRFAKRGVMGHVVLDTAGQGGVVQRVSGLLSDRRSARLLRACDIVLTHDRVRSSIVTSLSPGVLDIDFVQVGTIARPGPWIQIERKYEPAANGSIVDLVIGAAADTGRDILHLATLYLLSPEGQDPGSIPDETWEPSVEHHREWNLQYRAIYEDTIVEPTRLTIAVPQLGLGALGMRAQPILDEINARTAELEAQLRRVENAGTFSLA
jgi:hypothetical protein